MPLFTHLHQVTLTLRPPGSQRGAATRSVALTRKAVAVRPVTHQVCDGVAANALPPGEARSPHLHC